MADEYVADITLDIDLEVYLTDNSKEVLDALPKAIKRALYAVGAFCEEKAKAKCPVKTGFLRNSITFAVGGEGPNIVAYSAEFPDETGAIRQGGYNYNGRLPGGDYVLIGSNVEYAADQELGNSNGISGRHLIQDAVANGDEQLKNKIIESFKNI